MNNGFKAISDVEKLEEEKYMNWYKSGVFYPVRIGQILLVSALVRRSSA